MNVNKRHHVIEAAMVWIQNHAVDEVKVETILELATVSKTTFHEHFSNQYDWIECILKQVY